MAGKVEYYRDSKKQLRWRIRSANGRIVATSGGDGYGRKRDLLRGLAATATLIAKHLGR